MSGLGTLFADVMVLFGTAVMGLGIIGILRLRDVQARIHSSGKAFSLGIVAVLLATAGTDPAIFARAIIIGAFVLITGPVGTHALSRLQWHLEGGEPSEIDEP